MRRQKSKHVTSSLNLYLLKLVLVLSLLSVEQQKLLLWITRQLVSSTSSLHLSSLVTPIDSAGVGMLLVLYRLSVVQQSLELMITAINSYYHLFRKTMVLFLLQQLRLMIMVTLFFLLLQVRKTTVVFSTQSSLLLKEPIPLVVQHMLLDFLLGLVLVDYLLLVDLQRLRLLQSLVRILRLETLAVLQPYSDLVHTMDLEHSTHSVVLQNLELGYTTEIFLLYLHLKTTVVSILPLQLTKIKVR